MVVVNGNEVKGIITRKNLLPDALLRRLQRLHRNMDYVYYQIDLSRSIRPGFDDNPYHNHHFDKPDEDNLCSNTSEIHTNKPNVISSINKDINSTRKHLCKPNKNNNLCM